MAPRPRSSRRSVNDVLHGALPGVYPLVPQATISVGEISQRWTGRRSSPNLELETLSMAMTDGLYPGRERQREGVFSGGVR